MKNIKPKNCAKAAKFTCNWTDKKIFGSLQDVEILC